MPASPPSSCSPSTTRSRPISTARSPHRRSRLHRGRALRLRAPRRAARAALAAHGLTAPTGHAFLASESFVNPDGSGTTVPVPRPRWSSPRPDAGHGHRHRPLHGSRPLDDRRADRADRPRSSTPPPRSAPRTASASATTTTRTSSRRSSTAVTGSSSSPSLLDPRVVLEVDLYWVARAGVDSPTLLRTLGDRVVAVHVKDGTLDPAAIAAYPPADQVPAGQGAVPLAEALAAASALEFADRRVRPLRRRPLRRTSSQSAAFLDGRASPMA